MELDLYNSTNRTTASEGKQLNIFIWIGNYNMRSRNENRLNLELELRCSTNRKTFQVTTSGYIFLYSYRKQQYATCNLSM